MKILARAAALGFIMLPLFIQAGSPVGWVDNIDSNGTVYGWAKDPDSPNSVIGVHIYTGGTFIGGAWANHYHDAAVGTHGFRFTLPENIRSAPRTITVWGLDVTGDPHAQLSNGNPYPATVNVAGNDNCVIHKQGWPYQIGARTAAIAGGRPNNKLATKDAKSTNSAVWNGKGVPWFQAGNTSINLVLAARLAGAVSSITWDNVEMLDSGAHGTALQYIYHDSTNSELFNPTEAGSNGDDTWSWTNESLVNLTTLIPAQNPGGQGGNIYQHGSSSALNVLEVIPGALHTNSRMAHWVPKKPVGVSVYFGNYPKPWNTIYDAYHSVLNPPSPPGYNANAAFWSTYGPPNTEATRATHVLPLPDVLPAAQYEGVEPLSDYILDKTVRWGVPGHPGLNNVARFNATITLPNDGSVPNDFQLVLYGDRIRFRQKPAARTLYYNWVTNVWTDKTNTTSGASYNDVAIMSSEANRYAVALCSRGAPDCYQFHQQSLKTAVNPWIELGTGVQSGITPAQPYTLKSYVIVGTLADVQLSIEELYSINPAP